MVTRSLIEFIQKERSAGTTKDRIVAILKEKGWKDADILGGFAALAEEGTAVVPLPPRVGLFAETCEIFSLIWKVYRSRWKRFVGMSALYLVVLALMELAFFMWVSPMIPQFLNLISVGAIEAAFAHAVPYLLVGSFGYVLVQLWYVGSLYAIALRKGDSFTMHARAGLQHLPAVFGIKFVIAVLLMIVCVPPIVTAFLTQNPLVLFLFGPLFFMGSVVLWFLLSLAIPAYFHGTHWRSAAHESLTLVCRNAWSVLGLYLSFGVLAILFFLVIRDTPFVTVPLTLGLALPIQILFMIALYRRFSPQTLVPASSPLPVKVVAEAAPVVFEKRISPQTEKQSEQPVEKDAKIEKKRERRPRRTPKPPTA